MGWVRRGGMGTAGKEDSMLGKDWRVVSKVRPGSEIGLKVARVSSAGGVWGEQFEAARRTGDTREGDEKIAGEVVGTDTWTWGGAFLNGNKCSSNVTWRERYNLPVWRSKHLKACWVREYPRNTRFRLWLELVCSVRNKPRVTLATKGPQFVIVRGTTKERFKGTCVREQRSGETIDEIDCSG